MINKNIVSFGAGQNSTAMIIWMFNNNYPIDEIIFADTGNEMPETYSFLKPFKEWCKEKNLKFTTVKSKDYPLRDLYYSKKIIPFRMYRSCTDRFKIRPINKYVKENYLGSKINMYMGITIEEKHRVKETSIKNQEMIYPFITQEFDRKKCIDIINKEGLPVPVKSGCYFCPFQSKKLWLELLRNHPHLFEDAMEFEENCSKFPDATFLNNTSLRNLKEIEKSQTKLNQFIEMEDIKIQQCTYCHN